MATCARCKTEPAPHLVRSEYLCRDCFIKWIGVKVAQRMSSFRVGPHAVKNVLLAVSFGSSSLSLLALLDRHRETARAKANRVGYEVTVLHILGADAHEKPASAAQKIKQLVAMFPRFTFTSAALEAAIPNEAAETSYEGSQSSHLSIEALAKLSASSHEDMMLILRKRLIMQKARELRCTSVLFGDSTTKMSERILAETAKGRGFALPQLIGGVQTDDGIDTVYPLRDIYRGEIEEYAKHIQPELWALSTASIANSETPKAASRTASSRNMTIDKLLEQYMAETEQSTPSIVTNVLRTSQKLVDPKRELSCQVCGMRMDAGSSGLRGWGGDQDIDLEHNDTGVDRDPGLCYGCTRSLYGN